MKCSEPFKHLRRNSLQNKSLWSLWSGTYGLNRERPTLFSLEIDMSWTNLLVRKTLFYFTVPSGSFGFLFFSDKLTITYFSFCRQSKFTLHLFFPYRSACAYVVSSLKICNNLSCAVILLSILSKGAFESFFPFNGFFKCPLAYWLKFFYDQVKECFLSSSGIS